MAQVFACDRCGAIVPVPQGGQSIVLLSTRGQPDASRLMSLGDIRKEVCEACVCIIRSAIVGGPPVDPTAGAEVIPLRRAS